MDKKAQIIAALYAWIRQRPGLEYGNYGTPASYRSEMRSITKDLHTARRLLRDIELSGITAEQLIHASEHAFSGRLSITPKGDGFEIDYCTGQYWPTEYRKAVCAVCANALWDHYRGDIKPKPGQPPGDAIRANFRKIYGRGIQSTWFG